MSWCSKELGGGVAALAPTEMLQKLLLGLTMEAAKRGKLELPGPSLWSRHDIYSDVVTVYLSPEGEWIAKMLEGFAACEKPDREDLGLLYGAGGDWERHYPDGPKSSRFGFD